MRPAAETPIAFVRSIVLAYERYGVDPRQALRAAHISPSLLRSEDARVTADQFEALSATAMQELDDEGLGWFSRRLPWGTNGMLCRASLPSQNLRVALLRWCRHYGLLVDDIRLELSVEARQAHLIIRENRDLLRQREFCLVSTLRNIHGFACWLVDSRIPLSRATFPFRKPRHARAYDLMFRGSVDFEAPQASLVFDAEYLQLPVRRDDHDLRQMLLRPLPLIVLQYKRDRLLSQRIRKLFRTRGFEVSTAAAVAGMLNVSTRTLYRHLAEEGVSLQGLKDEARRELAIQQLARTSRPLKQIAIAAGFGSEASFIRAFRQWTGKSPGELRRTASVEK
ncbi:AraC family transcriptional regulator [Cupriavidus necator]|uniref:AraC family transcriptional regulator n=1 Tax=Cupriavidus necator TaxID=106590 RepID=UPI0039C3CEE5